ncbi:hypothetical protein AAF712_007077 [Marasmius tenuissimus]|uniref:Uncharacterized protein n=1 Tax=Marasmius tenuissimus TaxID=585030 RepID=A0ABR2ZX88_9AGAR|nr:hypothetical protein PM082_009929 [Marasmius tenuissimus]
MHFTNFTLLSLLALATGIANAAKIGDHCDPAQIAATYAEICGPREAGAGSAIWKCDNNKWIIKEDCGVSWSAFFVAANGNSYPDFRADLVITKTRQMELRTVSDEADAIGASVTVLSILHGTLS